MATDSAAGLSGTLAFLRLLAYDVRWMLVKELARSDRTVSELTVRLGRTGNLISYHLGLLKSEGLVRERRSSWDAREVYYSLDLPRMNRMFGETATEVHRGLGGRAQPLDLRESVTGGAPRVLFLCTHNSARSQMAEGLLRHVTEGSVSVHSAGSSPTELHPLAVAAMDAIGVDLAGQHAKHLAKFKSQRFDMVVTLCDSLRETCPAFEGAREMIHWSLPDPVVPADPKARHAAFQSTAAELVWKVHYLLPLLASSVTSAA